jgi:ribosomal protein S18 acetylase RimI-like enzyme
MPEPITISPPEGSEAEWCARLMSSLGPWKKYGRTFELCLQRIHDPEYLVWIARQGATPCGFIIIHPRGVAGSPYIASVGVAPEFQGQSIGTELVTAAERHFPAARNIFLCVSDFNPRARVLYERLGYAVVAEFDDYVTDGTTEFLMRKRLQPR